MSFCFAFGGEDVRHKPPNVYAIEYIEFDFHDDFERTSITIAGDFFFPNCSNSTKKCFFLHRGDIDFKQHSSEEIVEPDSFYSAFLKELWAPSLSAKFGRDWTLRGLFGDELKPVSLKEHSDYPVHEVDTRVNGKPLLSFYELEVPPRTCSFVRLVGSLKGTALDAITHHHEDYDIFGGKVLLERLRRRDLAPNRSIFKKDLSGYRRVKRRFDEFIEKEYVVPSRYDVVLWATPNSKPFISQEMTNDLLCKYDHVRFCNKEITWYWTFSPTFELAFPQSQTLHINLEPVNIGGFPGSGIWKYRS